MTEKKSIIDVIRKPFLKRESSSTRESEGSRPPPKELLEAASKDLAERKKKLNAATQKIADKNVALTTDRAKDTAPPSGALIGPQLGKIAQEVYDAHRLAHEIVSGIDSLVETTESAEALQLAESLKEDDVLKSKSDEEEKKQKESHAAAFTCMVIGYKLHDAESAEIVRALLKGETPKPRTFQTAEEARIKFQTLFQKLEVKNGKVKMPKESDHSASHEFDVKMENGMAVVTIPDVKDTKDPKDLVEIKAFLTVINALKQTPPFFKFNDKGEVVGCISVPDPQSKKEIDDRERVRAQVIMSLNRGGAISLKSDNLRMGDTDIKVADQKLTGESASDDLKALLTQVNTLGEISLKEGRVNIGDRAYVVVDGHLEPARTVPYTSEERAEKKRRLTELVGSEGKMRDEGLTVAADLYKEIKTTNEDVHNVIVAVDTGRTLAATEGIAVCEKRIGDISTLLETTQKQIETAGDEAQIRQKIETLKSAYVVAKTTKESLEQSSGKLTAISKTSFDASRAAYSSWETKAKSIQSTANSEVAILVYRMRQAPPAEKYSGEANYDTAHALLNDATLQWETDQLVKAVSTAEAAVLSIKKLCNDHAISPSTPLPETAAYTGQALDTWYAEVSAKMTELTKSATDAFAAIEGNGTHKDIADLQTTLTNLPIWKQTVSDSEVSKQQYERAKAAFESLKNGESVEDILALMHATVLGKAARPPVTLFATGPLTGLGLPIHIDPISGQTSTLTERTHTVLQEALIEQGITLPYESANGTLKQFFKKDGKYVGEFDKTKGKFKDGAESVAQIAGTNLYQVKDGSKIWLLNDKAKLSGDFQNQFKDGVDSIDTFDTGKFIVLKGGKKWLMDDEGKLLGQFRDKERFRNGVAEISKSSVEGINTVKVESIGVLMTYVTDASGEPLGEFGPKGAFSAGATACEVHMHDNAAYVIVTMSGDKSFVTDTKGTLLCEFRKGKLCGDGVSKESIKFRGYKTKDGNAIPALEVTAADGKVYLLELNRGVVLEYPAGMKPPNLLKKLQGVFEMKIKPRLDALMAKIPKVPEPRVPNWLKKKEKNEQKTISINITQQSDRSWKYVTKGFEASFADSVFTDDKYKQVTLSEEHIVFLKKIGNRVTPASLHTTSERFAKSFGTVEPFGERSTDGTQHFIGTAEEKMYFLTQNAQAEPTFCPDFGPQGIFVDGLSDIYAVSSVKDVYIGTTEELSHLDEKTTTVIGNSYFFDATGNRLGEFADGGLFADGAAWCSGPDHTSTANNNKIFTIGKDYYFYAIDSTGKRIGLFANGAKLGSGVEEIKHITVDGQRVIEVKYTPEGSDNDITMNLTLGGFEIEQTDNALEKQMTDIGLHMKLSELESDVESEAYKALFDQIARSVGIENASKEDTHKSISELETYQDFLSKLKEYLESKNKITHTVTHYQRNVGEWINVLNARTRNSADTAPEINNSGASVDVQLYEHTVIVRPKQGEKAAYFQKVVALQYAYLYAIYENRLSGVTVPPLIARNDFYESVRAEGCPIFLDAKSKNDAFFSIPTKAKAQALCNYLDFLARCNDQNRALIDHKGDSVFLKEDGHITIVDAGMLHEDVKAGDKAWQKEFGKDQSADMQLGTFLSRFFTCQSTGNMTHDGGLVPASIKSILQAVNDGRYTSANNVAVAIRKIIDDTDKVAEFNACEKARVQLSSAEADNSLRGPTEKKVEIAGQEAEVVTAESEVNLVKKDLQQTETQSNGQDQEAPIEDILKAHLTSETFTDVMLKSLTSLNLDSLSQDTLNKLGTKLRTALQWQLWGANNSTNTYLNYQRLISIRKALGEKKLISSDEHVKLEISQVKTVACDIEESDQLIVFLTSKEAQDAFLKSDQHANNQTVYDIYAKHAHSLDAKKREEVLKRFVNSKLLTPEWILRKTKSLLHDEQSCKTGLQREDIYGAKDIRNEVIEDRGADRQNFTDMNINPEDTNARILARIFGITEYKNVRIKFDAELQTYIFKKMIDLSLGTEGEIDITNHSVYFDQKQNKITLAKGMLGIHAVNRIELEFTGDTVKVNRFFFRGKSMAYTSLWKALHSTDLPAEDLATSMSIEGNKGNEHIVFSTNFTQDYITKTTAEHDAKIAFYTNQIQYLDSEIKKEEDEIEKAEDKKKKVDAKNAYEVPLQSANEVWTALRDKNNTSPDAQIDALVKLKEYLTKALSSSHDDLSAAQKLQLEATQLGEQLQTNFLNHLDTLSVEALKSDEVTEYVQKLASINSSKTAVETAVSSLTDYLTKCNKVRLALLTCVDADKWESVTSDNQLMREFPILDKVMSALSKYSDKYKLTNASQTDAVKSARTKATEQYLTDIKSKLARMFALTEKNTVADWKAAFEYLPQDIDAQLTKNYESALKSLFQAQQTDYDSQIVSMMDTLKSILLDHMDESALRTLEEQLKTHTEMIDNLFVYAATQYKQLFDTDPNDQDIAIPKATDGYEAIEQKRTALVEKLDRSNPEYTLYSGSDKKSYCMNKGDAVRHFVQESMITIHREGDDGSQVYSASPRTSDSPDLFLFIPGSAKKLTLATTFQDGGIFEGGARDIKNQNALKHRVVESQNMRRYLINDTGELLQPFRSGGTFGDGALRIYYKDDAKFLEDAPTGACYQIQKAADDYAQSGETRTYFLNAKGEEVTQPSQQTVVPPIEIAASATVLPGVNASQSNRSMSLEGSKTVEASPVDKEIVKYLKANKIQHSEMVALLTKLQVAVINTEEGGSGHRLTVDDLQDMNASLLQAPPGRGAVANLAAWLKTAISGCDVETDQARKARYDALELALKKDGQKAAPSVREPEEPQVTSEPKLMAKKKRMASTRSIDD